MSAVSDCAVGCGAEGMMWSGVHLATDAGSWLGTTGQASTDDASSAWHGIESGMSGRARKRIKHTQSSRACTNSLSIASVDSAPIAGRHAEISMAITVGEGEPGGALRNGLLHSQIVGVAAEGAGNARETARDTAPRLPNTANRPFPVASTAARWPVTQSPINNRPCTRHGNLAHTSRCIVQAATSRDTEFPVC